MKLTLKNVDLKIVRRGVMVTTRSGGRPSSPQPVSRLVRARPGQTREQLFRQLAGDWVDENGQ